MLEQTGTLEQTRILAKHCTIEQAEDNLKKCDLVLHQMQQTRWFVEPIVSF